MISIYAVSKTILQPHAVTLSAIREDARRRWTDIKFPMLCNTPIYSRVGPKNSKRDYMYVCVTVSSDAHVALLNANLSASWSRKNFIIGTA